MKYKNKSGKVVEAFKFLHDNIPDWYMDKVTNKSAMLYSDPEIHEDCKNPFKTHTKSTSFKNDDEISFHTANDGDFIAKDQFGIITVYQNDYFESTFKPLN